MRAIMVVRIVFRKFGGVSGTGAGGATITFNLGDGLTVHGGGSGTGRRGVKEVVIGVMGMRLGEDLTGVLRFRSTRRGNCFLLCAGDCAASWGKKGGGNADGFKGCNVLRGGPDGGFIGCFSGVTGGGFFAAPHGLLLSEVVTKPDVKGSECMRALGRLLDLAKPSGVANTEGEDFDGV